MAKPKPIITSPEEIAETSEFLGSMTVAGTIHAAYPSATSALCGLRRGAAEIDPEGFAPNCAECATTAARCAEIDNSAPAHWISISSR